MMDGRLKYCLSECDCMYVCLTVALCDCVHGMGQYQLGLGKMSLKGVPITTMQANLARDTPLAVIQPTLLKGTKVGLKNHEEVSQDQSRPFCN